MYSELDRETGALTPAGAATAVNPSFLTVDKGQRFLFAVNEVREFGGQASGAVSSFAIDSNAGELRFLNQVASGRGQPLSSFDVTQRTISPGRQP